MTTFWNRAFLFTFILGTCFLSLNAQVSVDVNAYKQKYKSSNIIFLNKEQHIRLTIEKQKIAAESDYIQQLLYLDNKSVGSSDRQVGYIPHFFVISKISAANYVPDEKGIYKAIPVKEFKDEERVDNDYIFYDGMRYKKFTYTGIVSGSVTELKYSYNYIDPTYIGAFYFQMGVPVDKNTFTVTHTSDIEIGYAFFGDSSNIQHTVTTKGKTVTHTWSTREMKEINSYSDAVDDRYFEPHVYVFVKRYKGKEGKMITLFGTPADLYRNDYKYIEKVNQTEIDAGLKAVVDSIKGISKDNEAIIKSVYKYVQQNYKYIAFEAGEGGHIPREANDVFQKKYGDCKDFASLITYMLKQFDIPSYLCWIGTRSLPYTFSELPLGYASNHMIAAVHDGKKWIFIDGTDKEIAYGTPSSFTQGKEALIAINKDSFVVERVPIVKPEANFSVDSIWIRIENDSIIAKGKIYLTGYNRTFLNSHLYYTKSNKKDDALKSYLRYGNNKRQVQNVQLIELEKDSLSIIAFDIILPDYIKKIDNELYINLSLRKQMDDDKIDTIGGRKAAKEFEYLFSDKSVVMLEIPQKYSIKTMPENKSYTDPTLQYQLTYSQQAGIITYVSTCRVDKLFIYPQDFSYWNKQMDTLAKYQKENLILISK